MKKTFLAMLLSGATMSMIAQTTPTNDPTTNQGNTTTTTNQSNTTTNTTTNQSTTDPSVNSTTNGTMNNGTMNNGTMNGTTTNGTLSSTSTNNATWGPSTSWSAETTPYWGWNSFGIWNGSGSMYNTTTAGTMNNGSNMTGSMNSTGNYTANSGVAVPYLPTNVQMHFSQDFPNTTNQQLTWSQYGDWFHSYYMGNGRLTQYFYDQRGNGYALALPVLQSYVPEDVVEKALNKYGANLYSISMVKTPDGNNAYQVGLIRGGQVAMDRLDENGVSVANSWRTEETDSIMMSTQSNAAMGTNGSMNNSSSGSWNNQSNMNSGTQSNTNTDMNTQSGTDMNSAADQGKTKIKIKNADGSQTKIKTKNGETKVKNDPATNNNNQ